MSKFSAESQDNGMWLYGAITALHDILDEAEVVVNEEGIRIRGLDRSHIQFVDLFLKSEFFDRFSFEEPMKFAVDTEDMAKAIKRWKRGDIVTLSDYGADHLKMKFDGKSTKDFLIEKVVKDYDSPEPPELDLEADAEVDFMALKEGLMDIALYSDKALITVKDEKLTLSSPKLNIEMFTKMIKDGNARSIFSIDKLRCGLNLLKDVQRVNLQLGDDTPLVIQVEKDGATYSTLTAPRISEDETESSFFTQPVEYLADKVAEVEAEPVEDEPSEYTKYMAEHHPEQVETETEEEDYNYVPVPGHAETATDEVVEEKQVDYNVEVEHDDEPVVKADSLADSYINYYKEKEEDQEREKESPMACANTGADPCDQLDPDDFNYY